MQALRTTGPVLLLDPAPLEASVVTQLWVDGSIVAVGYLLCLEKRFLASLFLALCS